MVMVKNVSLNSITARRLQDCKKTARKIARTSVAHKIGVTDVAETRCLITAISACSNAAGRRSLRQFYGQRKYWNFEYICLKYKRLWKN